MEKPVLSRLDKTVRRSAVLADGFDEYSGEWSTTEVAHLLKRTVFGVKVSDLKYFLSLSISQAVDELLTPSPLPSTVPLNSYSSDGYTDPTGAQCIYPR